MTLVVDNLQKSFTNRSGELSILRGVNLQLDRGQATAIMGPSGSGKSTLLHIVGTLDTPTSGTVRLRDQNPFMLPENELAQFRNKNIGFIFQDHHLLPQCSVLENVLIPTLIQPTEQRQGYVAKAKELLERVGMSPRLEHKPAELSGGERQRVAVARALILDPVLLLADEPTGNLDQHTADGVGELLVQLHEQLQTILIVVTHSRELAERFPKRLQMNNGQLQEM